MKTQHVSHHSKGHHSGHSTRGIRSLQVLELPAASCDIATLNRGIQQAKQSNRTYLVAHYQERLRQIEQRVPSGELEREASQQPG